ncbi:MAG: hypothetical protein QFB86_00795 [Patescibacteria group bacterium]|nr:hypothetical protein [Patescibacteria group bacterium]
MSEFHAVISVYSEGLHAALTVEPPVIDPELARELCNIAPNPYNWTPRNDYLGNESTEFQFPLESNEYLYYLGNTIIYGAYKAFKDKGHTVTFHNGIVPRTAVPDTLRAMKSIKTA